MIIINVIAINKFKKIKTFNRNAVIINGWKQKNQNNIKYLKFQYLKKTV